MALAVYYAQPLLYVACCASKAKNTNMVWYGVGMEENAAIRSLQCKPIVPRSNYFMGLFLDSVECT